MDKYNIIQGFKQKWTRRELERFAYIMDKGDYTYHNIKCHFEIKQSEFNHILKLIKIFPEIKRWEK